MPREQNYSWQFFLPLSQQEAWDFVSDTDRLNRLAGIYKVHYNYDAPEKGESQVQGEAHFRGMKFAWVELPAEWVEPEYLILHRVFHKGPFRFLEMKTELEALPEGTLVKVRTKVIPRHMVGALLTRYAFSFEMKKGFERALSQAENWQKKGFTKALGSEKPKISKDQERLLEKNLVSLVEEHGFEKVGQNLQHYLLSQPESELAALRPYVLADRWRVSRDHVLKFFLYATQAGILDLSWRLLCPSCRQAKNSFSTLLEVPKGGHCDACNIHYGVDFDRSIEAVFSPAPLGLGKEANQYCHAAPKNTPHRLVSLVLDDNESEEFSITLGAGKYQFVSPDFEAGTFFEVVRAKTSKQNSSISVRRSLGSAEAIELRFEEGVITGLPEILTLGSEQKESFRFKLFNQSGRELRVYLVRTAWADHTVSAADITALQEFRDLFGSEVLAPGAEFSIRTMVFLFSDLVGSTSMYEDVGDAKAFALVRKHFDLLREIYVKHRGALVKTIGDAVMAVFREPLDALRAALEMHQRIEEVQLEYSDLRLALKIGIHQGACIAMQANDRLDYFGTTVNEAARVQATAEASELSLTDRIYQAPGVQEALWEAGFDIFAESRQLRGLSKQTDFFRINTAQKKLKIKG